MSFFGFITIFVYQVTTALFISFLLLDLNYTLATNSLDKFVSYYEVTEQEIISLSPEAHGFGKSGKAKSRGDVIELKFRYSGELIDIEVARSFEMESDGVKLHVNGRESNDISNVSSKLYGIDSEDVSAFGYLTDENQYVGYIEIKNHTYFTEPAWMYITPLSSRSSVVIYRVEDVTIPARGGCTPLRSSSPPLSKSERQEPATEGARESMDFRKGTATPKMGRTRNTPDQVACEIEIIGDTSVYEKQGSNLPQTFAYLYYFGKITDRIFRTTDLGPKVVRILVKSVDVFETRDRPDYIFRKNPSSLYDILADLVDKNFNDFCVSFAVFSQKFTGDSIGLAYPGRICNRPTKKGNRTAHYNKAVMTTTDQYGKDMPTPVNILTFAHELGHSFGSAHDEINWNLTCSPGGKLGYYVMHPYDTTPGPLFDKFSPCSTKNMTRVVKRNYKKCLRRVPAECGNTIIEYGEECDCGKPEICEKIDKCCTPVGGLNGSLECTVRTELGYDCSDNADSCCVNCSFRQVDKICSIQGDGCLFSQCDGSSRDCPELKSVPDGSLCRRDSRTCYRGVCNSSVCRDNGLLDCTCRGGDSCRVCCQDESGCYPAIHFVVTHGRELLLFAGSSCDVTGQCDGDGHCVKLGGNDDESGSSPVVAVVLSLIGVLVSGALLYWVVKRRYGWAIGNMLERRRWFVRHDSEVRIHDVYGWHHSSEGFVIR